MFRTYESTPGSHGTTLRSEDQHGKGYVAMLLLSALVTPGGALSICTSQMRLFTGEIVHQARGIPPAISGADKCPGREQDRPAGKAKGGSASLTARRPCLSTSPITTWPMSLYRGMAVTYLQFTTGEHGPATVIGSSARDAQCVHLSSPTCSLANWLGAFCTTKGCIPYHMGHNRGTITWERFELLPCRTAGRTQARLWRSTESLCDRCLARLWPCL